MERQDLIQKLNALSLEIMPLVDKHILYNGVADPLSGKLLDFKEVDPRNVQARESVQALADVYEKAVRYVTLAELYFEFFGEEEESGDTLKMQMILFNGLARYSKRHIDEAISRLPN